MLSPVLRQFLLCMFKPRTVGTPFRMKHQQATAEVAGVVVTRIKLYGTGSRQALIAVESSKRFGVNSHSNGP